MFWTTTFIFWTADDAVAGSQSGGQTETPDSYPQPTYLGCGAMQRTRFQKKKAKTSATNFCVFPFLFVFPAASAFVDRARETAIKARWQIICPPQSTTVEAKHLCHLSTKQAKRERNESKYRNNESVCAGELNEHCD